MRNTCKYSLFLLFLLFSRLDAQAGKLEESNLSHFMLISQKNLDEKLFGAHSKARQLFDSLSNAKISGKGDSAHAELSYLLSLSLCHTGKYDKTINYLFEAIPLLRKMLPENAATAKKLINLSFLLSDSYQAVGLWDQSVDLQYKLLSEALHYKLSTEEAVIYNNLSSVMYRQKAYEQAVLTLLKAIEINEHQKDKEKLFVNYNNMSVTLVKLKKYDQAIEYAFLAIHQLAGDKNRDLIILVQRNIASIYLTINEFSLAEKYLKEVEKYQTAHKQNSYLAITYKIMGDLRARQKQYQAAESYYKQALSAGSTSLSDQAEIIKSYAQFCKERGDVNQTYALLEKYIRLKDSISSAEDKTKFSSIAGMYLDQQRLRSQETDQLQELRHALAGWKWCFALTFLLSAGGIALLFHRCQKRNKRQATRIKDQAAQLVSLSLDAMHKDEFMASVADDLTKLQQEPDLKNQAQRALLRSIISGILKQSAEDKNSYFENMNSGFYQVLLEKYPSLTAKDLRLCVLLKLGLSTKEIADITCKETRSVESARNRLRRKCELSQEVDLFKFFNRFS